MKRLVLLLAVIGCTAIPLLAQPAVDWLKSGVGPNPDDATTISISPYGDVFVGGTYSDSISFDTEQLKAYGNYDVFLARYASNGKIALANTYGGLDVDECNSIITDNKGNIYVSGAFVDQMLIGDTTLYSIDEAASADIFVAKFDRMGAFMWAKVFGSANFDESGPYLAADSTGNIYLTGIFGRTAQFDTKTIVADGLSDMFICKLNSAGTTQWVKKIGGIKNDKGLGIAINKDGTRIYCVGTFEGVVRFDATDVASFNDKADFFVIGYDNTGVIKWWHRIGTPNVDAGIACAIDKKDNLVVTGSFKGAMSFIDDAAPINSNGENYTDIFLCKYNPLGGYLWQKKYGGINEDHANAVAVDKNNNIYVCGFFDTETVFDENVIEAEGGRDGVMIKVSEAGEYDWLVQAMGPYDEEFHAVALDASNNPYVCGVFDTRMTLGDKQLTGQRFSDVFVAKLKCGPNTLFIPQVTKIDMCRGGDTTLRVKDGYPGYQWYDNNNAITGATRSRYTLDQLTTGTHKIKVQVTGYDLCVGYSVEVTVNVTDGMELPTISKSATELTVSIPDAKVYYWTREGKPTLSNGKQTISQEGPGLYRVRVTDSTGCTRWSESIVIGTTDVQDELVDGGVSVRPNPAFESVTILTGGDATVRVMDMVGKTVFADNVNESVVLQVGNLSPGVYTVQISRGSTVLHRTFIKQ